MIKAEYEAYWDCPKCGNLTTQIDDEHIDCDNGETLDIICKHDFDDKTSAELMVCNHEYQVDLRWC